MIERAEIEGKLTKDKVILEATSGNTGIGLALVGAAKGYKVEIVLPEDASMERVAYMQAFGAKIIFTPKGKGTAGAIEKAHELFKKNPEKYFMPDQFNNENNWRAHYETTGKEILEQIKEKIDVFVAGIGTGGTIMGIGKKLRDAYPEVKIVAVQPYLSQKIPGLRNLKTPRAPSIFKKDFVDEIVEVNSGIAMEMSRKLAREEGIFAGISSGAAIYVALKEAKKLKYGTIVTVFPDGGEKYISLKIFDKKVNKNKGGN